jgi:hypothetical protein
MANIRKKMTNFALNNQFIERQHVKNEIFCSSGIGQ